MNDLNSSSRAQNHVHDDAVNAENMFLVSRVNARYQAALKPRPPGAAGQRIRRNGGWAANGASTEAGGGPVAVHRQA